jgi:predicted HAD superfamily Cof-like phosphohydrolase
MTQGLNQIPGFEYYIADGQMLDDEIFYSSEEDAHAAVEEFHRAYGMLVNDPKAAEKDGGLRDALVHEERKEFLKELIDLVYVCVGSDVEYGTRDEVATVGLARWVATSFDMDFDGAFHEVHRSNMSKLGEDGQPIKREDGKVLKGPNYTPADMSAFV